ncbi:LysR family transcriptional regulator [Amylibacter ulvae]|uniref:LysR family transcriptional regulator n=1 Tax=Paramylibacter ulvae TaxID=1651968 RepID=A0ABQ3D1K8_9RHOB|nr:LysR family transcriptional regulator [Amylibacter ulvae]GHA51591.1 LysR family transcriptional regulator [Amylibacter ulvae]
MRLLLAIDQHGSVSRAGGVVGLSQPASSNALARLRTSLDDPLFLRTRDGMIPTPYCAKILPIVRANLAGIENALQQPDDFVAHSSSETFRLSLSDLGEMMFLPSLAHHMSQIAPNLRMHNIAAARQNLHNALQQRQCDIAIGILNTAGNGLNSTTLFHETYRAIIGRDVDPRKYQTLRDAPITLTAPSATYANDIEDELSKKGLANNIVLRLRHFGALPQLLNQMDVVAIVPSQYAQSLKNQQQAQILPIPVPLGEHEVKMIWHQITDSDPAITWFRQQILDVFGEPRVV